MVRVESIERTRVERTVETVVVDLENHPDMKSLIQERLYPSDSDLESDDTLNAWMYKDVTTGHHVSCTNKMGDADDPMSVVDQYGKVHGVDRLRVVDASIMPECVRANINVTVMTMAERISDFIKIEVWVPLNVIRLWIIAIQAVAVFLSD